MAALKCFACGAANSGAKLACENCGQMLLSAQEYEKRIQELKDYAAFRKGFGIKAAILAVLMLLFLYFVTDLLVRGLTAMVGTSFLPAFMLQYASILFVILIFIVGFLPLILSRSRILRKYGWSKEQLLLLENTFNSLPDGFLDDDLPEDASANDQSSELQGPPVILLVILFTLLAVVWINKYTPLKPLDLFQQPLEFFTSALPPVTAATVSGRYDCHIGAAPLGKGVARPAQTWSYVFHANGTYTSYLEGAQQYSGQWSQSGNVLTITVPAIPNLTSGYSFKAKVSRDASSFTAGERQFIKVK
ncbi:MAG: hypothetical protein ACM3QZ_01710 [Solirubrobacterales bacterium]